MPFVRRSDRNRASSCSVAKRRTSLHLQQLAAPGLITERIAVTLRDLIAMHGVHQKIITQEKWIVIVRDAALHDAVPSVESTARAHASGRHLLSTQRCCA